MILRVVLVLRLDLVQVLLKRFPSGRRQHGHAIFLTFAISDQNLVRSKIDVLYSQPQTLHKSKTRPVKQRGHDPIRTVKLAENRPDLFPRQYYRQAAGSSSPDDSLHVTDLFVPDGVGAKK